MDSPGGLNIKQKFRTFIKRSSLDTPSKCEYDLELIQAYFNNPDIRYGKPASITLNRNAIEAPLEEEEEDQILHTVEQEYYRQTLHDCCVTTN